MYQIYTKRVCNYCKMAKAEMDRLHLPYEEIRESAKTREELIARSGLNVIELTYPQIFDSHGKLIGGYEKFLDHTEQM